MQGRQDGEGSEVDKIAVIDTDSVGLVGKVARKAR